MDALTGRWVPCGRVPGDETQMEVTGLEPGHKYQFRVRAANEEGESDNLETDTAILAKDPFNPPGPPGTYIDIISAIKSTIFSILY